MGSKAFKPTLKNSLSISKFLGHPEKSLKLIHVAGSNGKGSTSSMLSSILTESGYKVGLFTSPHIKDFTERIRINGNQIPKEFVVEFIQKVRSGTFDFSPSFFEMTFGMALEYFKSEQCDVCIIETGLGGRFDATNIITPILSIITNISLEHTEMLGDTIPLIAKEKAGIIKSETPAVFGKMKPEAVEVMINTAKELNSSYRIAEVNPSQSFDIPLLGEYQEENFTTVLTSLNSLNEIGFATNDESITKGLKNLTLNTGFAGRLQKISDTPRIIQDVSHNPDGIRASIKTIKESTQGDLFIIYGTSKDKDIFSSISEFPSTAKVYFTEFSNNRTAKLRQLQEISIDFEFKEMKFFNTPISALENAKDCASTSDTILIIGSFFLISDFL